MSGCQFILPTTRDKTELAGRLRYGGGVSRSRGQISGIVGAFGDPPATTEDVPGGPPVRVWPTGLLILLGCVVLVLRRPEAVLLPQFFAEDGAVFFQDAFNFSIDRSLLLPHAGYQNLLPRMLAEVSFLFPIRYAPAFFNFSALIVASVSLCWIALPHFRHLIPGDRLRMGLVLLFWVMPNQEALMKLSYVQWYVLLWMALVSLMRLPRSSVGRNLLALGCLIGFLTAPVAAVLLPVWALRAWSAPDRRDRLFGLAMLAVGTVMLIGNLATPYTGPAPLPDWTVPPLHVAHGIVNGIAYKVLCSLFGAHQAAWLANLGWWAVYLVSAAVVGGLTAAYLRSSNNSRLLGLTLLWLIVASVSCFALRPHFLEDFRLGRGLQYHDRYFFLALALAYVAVFVVLSRLPALRSPTVRSRVIGTALLTILLALHLPTFRYTWTPLDQRWREVSQELVRLQDSVNQRGVSSRAVIPINPPGWSISLQLRPDPETTVTEP
jgi:hypothetical protein